MHERREVGGAIPVPLDTLKPIADSIAAANAPPTDVLAMVVQPLVAAGVLAPAQVGTLAPLVGQLQDVFGEVRGASWMGFAEAKLFLRPNWI